MQRAYDKSVWGNQAGAEDNKYFGKHNLIKGSHRGGRTSPTLTGQP